MSTRRVVITGMSFPSGTVQELLLHGLQVDQVPGDLDPDSVAARLEGAWGYILGGSERMPRDVWERLPELKVVCFLGTGYQAFIEMPDCQSETVFTYTPYTNADAVAEFAVALVLDRVRLVSTRAAEVARGAWREVLTESLIGARVGVAGMGHIGRAVARIVTGAFGADLVYWNRTPREELGRTGYGRAESIADLCDQVGVLVVTMAHVPGDNDGIIGEQELASLDSHGVVVNVAQAGLIEPTALRKALVDGHIAAAAIDGYYQEPTPHPDEDSYGLLALYPKLLVTPCSASLTTRATRHVAEMAATNLLAVLAGNPPPHPVPMSHPRSQRDDWSRS